MRYVGHELFRLLFSAILVVMYFITISWIFLVLNQFYLGLWIQDPYDFITVEVVATISFY